jgi:acyl carrier protein
LLQWSILTKPGELKGVPGLSGESSAGRLPMSDEDRIADIIVDTLACESIKLSFRFKEDLGADSLKVVELIMSVEDKFGIQISDDRIETIRTVGDLIAFIKAEQHV